MRRKRKIHYHIVPNNDYWWVKGKDKPVPFDDPEFKGKSKSNTKYCHSMKRAMFLFKRCPIGAMLYRFVSCGKGYVLVMEWEKLK